MPIGPKIVNRVKVAGRSVDVRCDGGQVGFQPSVTPAGRYVLFQRARIAELPESWLAAITEVERPPAPRIDLSSWTLGGELRNQSARVLAYCRRKAEEDPSIQGSNGSAPLARWAGAIFWKLGLNEAEGMPLLTEMNAIGASPPWSETELRHAMESGMKPHPSRPEPRGHLLAEWARKDERGQRRANGRAPSGATPPELDNFGPLDASDLDAVAPKNGADPQQSTRAASGSTDWRLLLSMKPGSKRWPAVPRKCLENTLTALLHCPDWQGVLRYDEFSDRTVVARPLPRAPNHHDGATELGPLRDGHVLWAIAWFHEELGFEPSVDSMHRAMVEVARCNIHHPVREYLRSFQWDRRPRCDRMLSQLFGAEDSEVTRAISAKWLIGAVARVMRPGCQVDHMLVLEGPQGSRKSTALKTLVGDSWFRNSAIDLRSKDAAITLRGCWVFEFDELDAFRGRDATRVKSFLTLRTDSYRPAYGREVVDVPRQCVFAGSTNEERYLSDPTGNRRFWPVRCGAIDIPGLTAVRDQIWAEAYARYCAAEPWHIESAGLIERFRSVQAEREEVDPWQAPVAAWWEDLHDDRKQQGVTTTDVFASVLELKLGHAERRDEMRVATCLRRIGLVRQRVMHRGARSWRYCPTTYLTRSEGGAEGGAP